MEVKYKNGNEMCWNYTGEEIMFITMMHYVI